LGPTPASDGNPSFQKKNFIFLKIMRIFSNFIRFGFGLGKAQLIFGPNLASVGNPSFQKKNFIFLKIMRIFQIFVALVLGSERSLKGAVTGWGRA
jgi:hypothetical protein